MSIAKNAAVISAADRMGRFIGQMRVHEGITLSQLAHGLCSVPFLHRIENGEREVGKQMTDAFFQRLGKPVELFERILDWDEFQRWSRRQRIGFVFQAYNLLEEHTAKENILMPLHLDGRKEDKAFFDEVVAALEIGDKLSRYPDQLSGGEQQRAAIARALVTKPAILLADEPTGNLDPKTGDQVLALLKNLAAKFDQTIILVTHDMEIAAMADEVIRLDGGSLVGNTR